MRVSITLAILALIAVFILLRGVEIASRKERSTRAVASKSPEKVAIETEEFREQPLVSGPAARITNSAAKRFYQEALRVKFSAIYFRTKAKILRDEVNQLSSARIELNVSKEEAGKRKGSPEYKNAVNAGAKLEAANHRLWENLLKQKYYDELLSLARHRPHAFARRQRVTRQGEPTLSYLLGHRLLRRRGEQKQ